MADSRATKAATTAAIEFSAVPPETLQYSSLTPNLSDSAAYIFPPNFDGGESCWIPTTSDADTEEVLRGITVDDALIYQRRSVPIASEGIKDLAYARSNYLSRVASLHGSWVDSGRVVNEGVARELSAAREALRREIQATYVFSGRFAKAFDAARFRSFSPERVRQAKIATDLSAGRFAKVITNATTNTNNLANQMGAIAKTSLPVVRGLQIFGTLAVGLEVPYRAYELYTARDDTERGKALENFTGASVGLGFAAVCAVATISTAGAAFVACGLAPVFTGYFAGKAAKAVYLNLR